LNDDPIIDWLDLHGSAHGFHRDDELDGYQPELDFSKFVMAKGVQF
jgi:hypothetical protein